MTIIKKLLISVFAILFAVGFAQAATTISTNVSTGGTLAVTGVSTLTGLTSMIQASSTRFSVHDTAYFGGSATSTFASTGALTLAAALSGTSGTFSTTLGVTGLTSMIQASSTRFSVHDTAYFGGSATSTFASTGALTLAAALSGTSGTFSTTLSVTGLATFLAGATTTQMTYLSGDTFKNATASSTVLSADLTIGSGATGSGDLTILNNGNAAGTIATSTVTVGCINTTATSSATQIKLVFNTTATSSGLVAGTNSGFVLWQYGTCP